MAFSPPEYCRLFAQKKAYQAAGGGEATKQARKEGWKKEVEKEGTYEVSEYIPGGLVGIWSSKKEYKYVFLYRQYFYVLYQECSSVTIRWTIS